MDSKEKYSYYSSFLSLLADKLRQDLHNMVKKNSLMSVSAMFTVVVFVAIVLFVHARGRCKRSVNRVHHQREHAAHGITSVH